MNPLYFLIVERARHRCEYCHAPESIFNVVLEVEHITPVVAGGTSTEENLAVVFDLFMRIERKNSYEWICDCSSSYNKNFPTYQVWALPDRHNLC